MQDGIEIVALREAMLAGDAVLCAAELFVITQIRKTAGFGARADALGKDTGKKERVITDVQAQLKAGAVVSGLERGDHFEKIVEWIDLTREDAIRPLRFRKGGQHFGHVIGYTAIGEVRAFEDVADKDVKVKTGGDLQATAVFQQGTKEDFIVQNQVTRVFVGEQFDETLDRAQFLTEHFDDEFDVLGRELHPAVGLNQFHRLCFKDIRIIFLHAIPAPAPALLGPCRQCSINGSNQRTG